MTRARIVVEHEIIIEGLYLVVLTNDGTHRFKPQIQADLDYTFIFEVSLPSVTFVKKAELYSQDMMLLKRTEINRNEQNFTLTYHGSLDESKGL
jgi:hypothetical protein